MIHQLPDCDSRQHHQNSIKTRIERNNHDCGICHDTRTTDYQCHQHHVMSLMMWGIHHYTVSAFKLQYSVSIALQCIILLM